MTGPHLPEHLAVSVEVCYHPLDGHSYRNATGYFNTTPGTALRFRCLGHLTGRDAPVWRADLVRALDPLPAAMGEREWHSLTEALAEAIRRSLAIPVAAIRRDLVLEASPFREE